MQALSTFVVTRTLLRDRGICGGTEREPRAIVEMSASDLVFLLVAVNHRLVDDDTACAPFFSSRASVIRQRAYRGDMVQRDSCVVVFMLPSEFLAVFPWRIWFMSIHDRRLPARYFLTIWGWCGCGRRNHRHVFIEENEGTCPKQPISIRLVAIRTSHVI